MINVLNPINQDSSTQLAINCKVFNCHTTWDHIMPCNVPWCWHRHTLTTAVWLPFLVCLLQNLWYTLNTCIVCIRYDRLSDIKNIFSHVICTISLHCKFYCASYQPVLQTVCDKQYAETVLWLVTGVTSACYIMLTLTTSTTFGNRAPNHSRQYSYADQCSSIGACVQINSVCLFQGKNFLKTDSMSSGDYKVLEAAIHHLQDAVQ